ncbi:glycosyltransferase family 87 protein [Actinocrispum wychmicini]|uniref:glycosyltransferase family 87 protein n=1 Tax=Actinocrispum wychmicini TaxID=1213861 RepID=UPI00104E3E6A|nr:glycosyltransferase family 87 protein [Actinocrispum wychmicini]
MRVLLWVGAATAAMVTIWFLVAYGSANVARIVSTDVLWHADLDTFHRSAVALLHGGSIYDTGAKLVNLNPPVWTVLFAPLGLLKPLAAYWVFSAVTAVLVLGSALLVARELDVSPRAKWLAVAAMALSSPFMGTVAVGQVYGVLLAGLTLSWLATRRGHLAQAGVYLGLVVALKPTLAPLLLLPLVQRQWRTVKAAIVGVLAATVVGMVVAGPATTVRWLSVVRTEGLSTFGDNASLPSLVARLGGPAWLGFLLGAAAVGYTLRRTTNLWALTAATLLLSPIAWHNYLVLCFPGVFAVLMRRRFATAAFLLTLPLIGVEWGMHLWKGDSLVDRIGQSLYCFVLVSWWVVLTVQHDRDDPGEVREPGDLGGAEHGSARTAHQ